MYLQEVDEKRLEANDRQHEPKRHVAATRWRCGSYVFSVLLSHSEDEREDGPEGVCKFAILTPLDILGEQPVRKIAKLKRIAPCCAWTAIAMRQQ